MKQLCYLLFIFLPLMAQHVVLDEFKPYRYTNDTLYYNEHNYQYVFLKNKNGSIYSYYKLKNNLEESSNLVFRKKYRKALEYNTIFYSLNVNYNLLNLPHEKAITFKSKKKNASNEALSNLKFPLINRDTIEFKFVEFIFFPELLDKILKKTDLFHFNLTQSYSINISVINSKPIVNITSTENCNINNYSEKEVLSLNELKKHIEMVIDEYVFPVYNYCGKIYQYRLYFRLYYHQMAQKIIENELKNTYNKSQKIFDTNSDLYYYVDSFNNVTVYYSKSVIDTIINDNNKYIMYHEANEKSTIDTNYKYLYSFTNGIKNHLIMRDYNNDGLKDLFVDSIYNSYDNNYVVTYIPNTENFNFINYYTSNHNLLLNFLSYSKNLGNNFYYNTNNSLLFRYKNGLLDTIASIDHKDLIVEGRATFYKPQTKYYFKNHSDLSSIFYYRKKKKQVKQEQELKNKFNKMVQYYINNPEKLVLDYMY